jgi:hypothetical protein
VFGQSEAVISTELLFDVAAAMAMSVPGTGVESCELRRSFAPRAPMWLSPPPTLLPMLLLPPDENQANGLVGACPPVLPVKPAAAGAFAADCMRRRCTRSASSAISATASANPTRPPATAPTIASACAGLRCRLPSAACAAVGEATVPEPCLLSCWLGLPAARDRQLTLSGRLPPHSLA